MNLISFEEGALNRSVEDPTRFVSRVKVTVSQSHCLPQSIRSHCLLAVVTDKATDPLGESKDT